MSAITPGLRIEPSPPFRELDNGALVIPVIPPPPSFPRRVEADSITASARLVLQNPEGYRFGYIGIGNPYHDDNGDLVVDYMHEAVYWWHCDVGSVIRAEGATRAPFRPLDPTTVRTTHASTVFIERPMCPGPDCQRAAGPMGLCYAHQRQQDDGETLRPV